MLTKQCILSPREQEVLRLLAHEHTTKEIAKVLFISDHTVISHRKNLMNKLGAKNVAGLIRRGYEERILSLKSLINL